MLAIAWTTVALVAIAALFTFYLIALFVSAVFFRSIKKDFKDFDHSFRSRF